MSVRFVRRGKWWRSRSGWANVAPRFSPLATAISAPLSSRYFLTKERPRPTPSNLRVRPGFSCEKAAKMCGRYSASMPTPLSRTCRHSAACASRHNRTVTPPRSVNLIAFCNRLVRVLERHPSSNITTACGSSIAVLSARPFSAASTLNSPSRLSMNSASATGLGLIGYAPDSILDSSRIEAMVSSRRLPARRTGSA